MGIGVSGTIAMETGAEERGSKWRQEMIGYWGHGNTEVGELLQKWGGPWAILWMVTSASQGSWSVFISLVCFPQLRYSSHSYFRLHWCRGPHLAPSGSLVHDPEEMEA